MLFGLREGAIHSTIRAMNDQNTPPTEDDTLPDSEQDSVAVPAEPEAAEAAPEIAAEAPAVEDSELEPEAQSEDEPVDADEYDDTDEDYLDEEYGELDELADEDEDVIETSPVPPVDWSALANAGASISEAEVPDLTSAGAGAMEVDIDAALAAVDSLGAVVAAEQERKREESDRREAQRRADEEYRRWAESYIFRRPGMIRVQGGRVVTILPAVALMAVGGVLTLATASGQTMSWQTLAAAASAGLSVSLISYWLASGRWARGALFAALVVAAGGAWVFVSAMPDAALSWTLPFIMLGAAFALTGLLGRPRTVPWILAGLGIIAGTVIGPLLSQRVLVTAAPFVLGAAAILAVLPVIFRVRRS